MFDPSPQTLADQRPAIEALTLLATHQNNLPPAYIVMSHTHCGQLEVQLQNLAALEAWRHALLVAPSAVELRQHPWDARATVEFTVPVAEATVHVYAMAGPLAEQSHQLLDPAVPVLPGACRMAVTS